MKVLDTLRVLVTEPVDPSRVGYKWLTPALRALECDAMPMPTLAAVQLLGPGGYRSMLRRVVEEWLPHVLLIRPPLDFLDAQTSNAIRNLGTQIVGLTRPAGIHPPWSDLQFEDLRSRLDAWLTPEPHRAALRAGARLVRWAAAPASVETVEDPAAPQFQVAIVAPATEERAALARALAAEVGLKVGCFGPGWAAGPLTHQSRIGLLRRAAVVVTFTERIGLIDSTFFEAAQLGKLQVVEWCADLARYVPTGGNLATFVTSHDCMTRLRGWQSLPLWTAVPPLREVWASWVEGLERPDLPDRQSSPALAQLYASLTHVYEARNLLLQAISCAESWAIMAPDDPDPHVARARCHAARAEWRAALQATNGLRSRLRGTVPVASSDQHAFLRPAWTGTALGKSRAVDPTVDLSVLRLTAFVALDQVAAALHDVSGMTVRHRAAVAQAYETLWSNPDSVRVYEALSSNEPVEGPPQQT